jgi:hypothetical protein
MAENMHTPFFLRLQVLQPRERPATFTMFLGFQGRICTELIFWRAILLHLDGQNM